MQDKMLKMLMAKKKEGKGLSDSEKKSKLQALEGMKGMAHKMMSDKLHNLKKVTVASDSAPGLKQGLQKAEDILDKSPEDQDGEEPAMLSEGGNVYDRGDKGGPVAKMPEEFDTDIDNVNKEHQYDEQPRNFADGGDVEDEMNESDEDNHSSDESSHNLQEMVDEAPEDPEQLDELIKKLEEKKQQLATR